MGAGAFAFRTDPSIALRGIPRAFDPIQAYSRIARLRQLQQRGQFNQRQLEEMERKRARLEDIRGIAAGAFEPGKGLNRAEFLQRLAPKYPLAGLEYGERFAAEARAAAGEKRAQGRYERNIEISKEKQKLAKHIFDLDRIGRAGFFIKYLEDKNADRETLAVAWVDQIGRLEKDGVDTSWIPKEYAPGLSDAAIAEALPLKDQLNLRLRQIEHEERKAAREKKVPGVHVPFPPAVEAQKRRLARPSARDLSTEQQRVVARLAREAMRNAGNDTAKAIQNVNDSVDQGVVDPALLDDVIRMIRLLQVRGRTKGRGSVEDEVDDALNKIVQE
jgi:hypothetical protein